MCSRSGFSARARVTAAKREFRTGLPFAAGPLSPCTWARYTLQNSEDSPVPFILLEEAKLNKTPAKSIRVSPLLHSLSCHRTSVSGTKCIVWDENTEKNPPLLLLGYCVMGISMHVPFSRMSDALTTPKNTHVLQMNNSFFESGEV